MYLTTDSYMQSTETIIIISRFFLILITAIIMVEKARSQISIQYLLSSDLYMHSLAHDQEMVAKNV